MMNEPKNQAIWLHRNDLIKFPDLLIHIIQRSKADFKLVRSKPEKKQLMKALHKVLNQSEVVDENEWDYIINYLKKHDSNQLAKKLIEKSSSSVDHRCSATECPSRGNEKEQPERKWTTVATVGIILLLVIATLGTIASSIKLQRQLAVTEG